MDFLKKHYEKVLLGAVLVGLAVAVGFLPFKISSEKQALEDLTRTVTTPQVTPLTNLNLTQPLAVVKRAAAPVVVDFTLPHRLFSPMPWQKTAEGRLVPVDETQAGPRAVVVGQVSPLHTTLTLDSIQSFDSGPKYVIGIEREGAATSRERKQQTYVGVGDKNKNLTLLEVQGPPEAPTNLVLELSDGTVANVAKDKPFRRVEGYTADLRYDPERKNWPGRRVGNTITFNGEDYNIVAINESEVVLSAKSNQKKWTINRSPTATPEPN